MYEPSQWETTLHFVTSCLIGWAHTQNDPCWWNESLKLIETRNIHVCFSSNKIHINISYFLTVIDRNNDIFEKKNKNFVFSHFSWIHSHLFQFLEFYTILYINEACWIFRTKEHGRICVSIIPYKVCVLEIMGVSSERRKDDQLSPHTGSGYVQQIGSN